MSRVKWMPVWTMAWWRTSQSASHDTFPRFLCQSISKNCCFPPQRVACAWGVGAAAAPGLAREALKIQALPYHLGRGESLAYTLHYSLAG